MSSTEIFSLQSFNQIPTRIKKDSESPHVPLSVFNIICQLNRKCKSICPRIGWSLIQLWSQWRPTWKTWKTPIRLTITWSLRRKRHTCLPELICRLRPAVFFRPSKIADLAQYSWPTLSCTTYVQPPPFLTCFHNYCLFLNSRYIFSGIPTENTFSK